MESILWKSRAAVLTVARAQARCRAGIRTALLAAGMALPLLGCSGKETSGAGEVESQQAEALAANQYQFSITTPAGNSASGVTMAASGSVNIGDRVTISAPSGQPLVTAGTTLAVGADGHVGSLFGKGAVSVRDRTNVGGFLFSATSISRGNGVTVQGAVNAHAAFDPPVVQTWVITYPSTSQGDLTLLPSSNGTPTVRTAAPNRYGKVTVNARTTLNLSSGVYYLDSLDLEPGGTLRLTQTSGPVELYVRTSVIYRGAALDAAGGASKLFLGYAGTNPIAIESSFSGIVAAPNAQLNLQLAVSYSGQFFANAIVVSAGASVTSRIFSDCQLPTTPNGTSCNDGNPCTINDRCQGGSCTGVAVSCAAQDQCHSAGTCDPATGACSNPVKPDGTACDDGSPSSSGETCQQGGCSSCTATNDESGTTRSFSVTADLGSGPVGYTQSVSEPSDGTVTTAVTITRAGQALSTETSTVSGSNVTRVTLLGPPFHGVHEIDASSDGVNVTLIVDGRSVQPIPIAAATNPNPPLPTLLFTDGNPAPVVTVDPGTLEAISGILSVASQSRAGCLGSVTAPTTSALDAAATKFPVVPGHHFLPRSLSGCQNCIGDCEDTLDACTFTTESACIGGTAGAIVGGLYAPAALIFGAACAGGSDWYCNNQESNCEDACLGSSTCCPQSCGNGCCNSTEACLDPNKALCCGAGYATCFGPQESCVDPMQAQCLSTGAGCPTSDVCGSGTSAICCSSGVCSGNTCVGSTCPNPADQCQPNGGGTPICAGTAACDTTTGCCSTAANDCPPLPSSFALSQSISPPCPGVTLVQNIKLSYWDALTCHYGGGETTFNSCAPGPGPTTQYGPIVCPRGPVTGGSFECQLPAGGSCTSIVLVCDTSGNCSPSCTP